MESAEPQGQIDEQPKSMGPPQCPSQASKTNHSDKDSSIRASAIAANPCSTTPQTSSTPRSQTIQTSSTPCENTLQNQSSSMLVACTNSSQNQEATPSKESTGIKLELGCKRKLKSDVWKHFKRIKVGEEMKSVCVYCNKGLSGNTSNGTSNLRSHWKTCTFRTTKLIKEVPKKVHQNVLTQRKGLDGKVSLGTFSFEQEDARKELAAIICLHEYPLAIVDHVGFRRFTSALQPLCKLISRNTVKKDIMAIYEFERDKTLKLLSKNKSRIAITTDMWSSTNQKRGFMAVTAHWIDDSWILQNRIIRFIYVPSPHTSKILCEELHATLLEWQLDQKLSAVTLDNCTTNNAMIVLLKDKLSAKKLLLDGKMLHMRCAAHILNLIVRCGLEVIGGDIDKIRETVSFWKATPKRDEMFEKYARQLEVPMTRKLVSDCKTRWNSTYLMLEVAIGYREVFSHLKALKKAKFNGYPDERTAYPTAHQFFLLTCQIKIEIEKWKNDENSVISSMAGRMSGKFDLYWNGVNNVMALASILDPRYKMKLMEFYFPAIYGKDVAVSRIDGVRKFCYNLFDVYQNHHNSSRDRGMVVECSSASSSLASLDLSNLEAFIDESNSTISENSELDKYLGAKCQPRTKEFDVLAWWKINANDYPILSSIARDILAIPVSTVASESAFSTSGRFVSPHRSRLRPKMLEVLMCAQDWMWAELKGSRLDDHEGYYRYYDELAAEDMDDEENMRTASK